MCRGVCVCVGVGVYVCVCVCVSNLVHTINRLSRGGVLRGGPI